MSGFLETTNFAHPYFPVLILLIIAVLTAAGLLVLSKKTGPRVYNKIKYDVYECGVDPLAPATVRVSVKFYLVALVFIIFDLEATFLYPWAILFRSMGILGFIEMAVFAGILLVGLFYVWKKGALEWQ
ncbi:MAG: NADH-quinone oxidoreductase subunit A [Thermodesulfobacteriota bacterium]